MLVGVITAGIAFIWLGVIGAVVTMCAQSYQPMAHNVSSFGGVLTMLGLLCFAIGLKGMNIENASDPDKALCAFCGKRTDYFQIQDCSLEDGIIIMIVGVSVVEMLPRCAQNRILLESELAASMSLICL